MRVTVTRGAGDKRAPEIIIDPLCIRQNVATERGKAYLYDVGFDKKEYTLTTPYRQAIYPGLEIGVHDSTLGESFVALVVSHTIEMTMNESGGVEIYSILIVERSMVDG